MKSSVLSRRHVLQLAGRRRAAALFRLARRWPAQAADAGTLTIAYNVNLPSFDPTVGLSAVNPTIQSIYQSVFDPYIGQAPDLSFKPGLLTKWGWNADRTKITLELRKGATWHDGSPVTPEDVVWSLQRAADPKSGNPIQFVWSKIGNYKIDGNTITGDVLEFEPTLFKWMAFLTAYVLPKAYYEKVGAEGFEKAPIGSGPYKVDAFERNAFLRLKAHPGYWGPKPAFETVVFKFVTDPTSRVAEIESGGSDVTFEIPYEEFDRLKAKPGLAGQTKPVSDIAMIFITDIDPMLDRNVRLAANHAIDKKAIVDRLLKGYGVPIATLEAPGYAAFDPSIKVSYDPELAKSLLAKSGYSPEKPVKFTIQTTRGFKPKDYEMIQAIVGMWRKVGIEANIEVYEIAKHFELRAAPHAGAGGVLQLGQCDRRSLHLDRLCDVRPVAALRLEGQGSGRAHRPAVGRKGRGQADRRLQGGRQIYRRGGRGDPAVPVCAADHPQEGPEGRGAVERHDPAATDHAGLKGADKASTTMRWGEIIRRLVLIPPTLFGVAVIVFVLLRVVPGDPIAMMIPPGATAADIERLRAFYGLDQPILQQFVTWFGQALTRRFRPLDQRAPERVRTGAGAIAGNPRTGAAGDADRGGVGDDRSADRHPASRPARGMAGRRRHRRRCSRFRISSGR